MRLPFEQWKPGATNQFFKMRLRTFCLRSLAGLVLLALAPWTVVGQPARRGRSKIIPLAELDYEIFAGLSGTMFHVHSSEERVSPLHLLRVDWKEPSPRENPNAPDAAFEKFSLVFAGHRAHQLPQETYTFEHPRLGRFEMFIVPVYSRDPAVHKYEAVFNRPSGA